MIWYEYNKLKKLDCSNANEVMTEILKKRILNYSLPFTEFCMKGVTFSCQFKKGNWAKFVKNRLIWNEIEK